MRERGDNKILNTKLPKLEFPIFKGNPLGWPSFYDQFNISVQHFRKSKLYKNNEAEIGQKIRTNLEHLETGKCKDKKNKNDDLYFFKTRYKRILEYHQNHQKHKKTLKRSKSKNKVKNINLVCITQELDEIDEAFYRV